MPEFEESVLEDRILAAHAENNAETLADLYTQAADANEAKGDIDAACFFLTHAYVFALEAGLPAAAELNKRLSDHGRDVIQKDLGP